VSYASLDSLNQVLLAKLARLDSLNALDKDTVIGNELQNLSLKGDSLFISEGNVVKINHPVNLDNDSTNELQSITLANDTITLSKGGGKIALKDISDYISSKSDCVKIGDYHAGGIVFYVDSTCQHGKVVTTHDVNNYDFNTGMREALIACDSLKSNGYSDWSLPSITDLELVYSNLGRSAFGIVNWANNYPNHSMTNTYWSSTKAVGYNDAFYSVNMWTGKTRVSVKKADFRIRAIRNF